jgi:hypothetical protein
MAKTSASTRRTFRTPKKKASKSRSEVYVLNRKYMGDEPVFPAGTVFDRGSSAYVRALNWYHAMCDKGDAREYLEAYAVGRSDIASKLTSITDRQIPFTAAWIARLIMRGVKIDNGPEFIAESIKNSVRASTSTSSIITLDSEDEMDVAQQPVVKTRRAGPVTAKMPLRVLIDTIENHLCGEEMDIFETMRNTSFPISMVDELLSIYEPLIGECERAIKGNKEDMEYVKARWKDQKPKDSLARLRKIVEDAQRYKGVKKTVKRQRKPRPVTTEKLLKRFKFMKECPDLKAASVDPSRIVGAKEVWALNTKYKTLTVYRADEKLTVNGVRIAGYNPELSESRTTGRKTQSVVNDVLSLGKVPLKKYMDSVKGTNRPVNDRFTEDTLILRVI